METRIYLLLGLLIWGCSNDTELPMQYHRGHLAQPTSVEAVAEEDRIVVSWDLDSAANVSGFVISFTDSIGVVQTRSLEDAEARSYEEIDLDLSPGVWYLIQVWAVDARLFFGPRSAVDTLAVF